MVRVGLPWPILTRAADTDACPPPRQPGEPRGMWTSNRLCEAAVLQRKTDIHRQRLREVRPTIDTRDPRRPKSSNTNGARMEAERNAQIM